MTRGGGRPTKKTNANTSFWPITIGIFFFNFLKISCLVEKKKEQSTFEIYILVKILKVIEYPKSVLIWLRENVYFYRDSLNSLHANSF